MVWRSVLAAVLSVVAPFAASGVDEQTKPQSALTFNLDVSNKVDQRSSQRVTDYSQTALRGAVENLFASRSVEELRAERDMILIRLAEIDAITATPLADVGQLGPVSINETVGWRRDQERRQTIEVEDTAQAKAQPFKPLREEQIPESSTRVQDMVDDFRKFQALDSIAARATTAGTETHFGNRLIRRATQRQNPMQFTANLPSRLAKGTVVVKSDGSISHEQLPTADRLDSLGVHADVPDFAAVHERLADVEATSPVSLGHIVRERALADVMQLGFLVGTLSGMEDQPTTTSPVAPSSSTQQPLADSVKFSWIIVLICTLFLILIVLALCLYKGTLSDGDAQHGRSFNVERRSLYRQRRGLASRENVGGSSDSGRSLYVHDGLGPALGSSQAQRTEPYRRTISVSSQSRRTASSESQRDPIAKTAALGHHADGASTPERSFVPINPNDSVPCDATNEDVGKKLDEDADEDRFELVTTIDALVTSKSLTEREDGKDY